MSLTIAETDHNRFRDACAFRPSMAVRLDPTTARSWLLNEVVRFKLQAAIKEGYLYGVIPSSVTASPVAVATPTLDRTMPVARAQDMAATLTKRLGFPISALSEVLDVERKTIYDWLNKGSEAQAETAERLQIITEIFKDEEDGSLRFFHRFWKRIVPGVGSLHEELVAFPLNVVRIRAAMEGLRPAVRESISYDKSRQRVVWDNASVPEFISENLEVISRG